MGDFGDRMKMLEQQEAGRRLLPLLPVCARLDGKCFSKFTKGLGKPYDKRMSDIMIATTSKLVEDTGAKIGYTQSDEISLVWYSDNYKSQIFLDGRIQKMVSILCSMATGIFNMLLPEYLPEKQGKLPLFDCRVWTCPTLSEATNVLLWREMDATKNSIASVAQSLYSHKQLHKKNGSEMQDMIFEAGKNWNDYPAFFKRGTFVQRRKTFRSFTPEELLKLPERHEARKKPDLAIERSEVQRIDMPIFSKITNRIGVVFNGEEPILRSEEE